MAVIHDDIGRRRFLSQAVMWFGLLFGMGTLVLRFIQALVPVTSSRLHEVLIGNEAAFAVDTAVPIDLGGQKIVVLRTGDGVKAFSRRCTDLGCLVSWDQEREQFICPCHQGVFDKTGRNIAGPPPRPLDQLKVVQRGDHLYVTFGS